MPRVLVAGIGNIFCRDDGFGPAVVAALARDPGTGSGASTEVSIVDYGIRGMHLAYDLLDPPDVLILIDALPDRGAAGAVSTLRITPGHLGPASTGGQLDAHGMDPATVLANLVALGGHLPETTLLVGAQVADVGEGMHLSPAVAASVDPAARVVQQLIVQHHRRAEEVA